MASAVGGVGSSNVIVTNQQAQIDGAPVGRPIPAMPALSETTPPLTSLGATGTAIFGGIITSEEYNSDFFWKDAVKIYEQMSRSDGQIAAITYMLELPIRRATWTIEPASDDPKDKEIASFVQSCLFTDLHYTTATGRKLTQKWDDVLRHILMMMRFGFLPLEVCYRKEDGWIKWSRFIPLLPRTIWRWWVGEDNELAGVQQWTFKNYNYTFIDIPADKLLLFVHRQEGNNYEGVSLLRAAYPHWWYKTQFYKIDAIGIEKNAVVPPVVYLPENASSADVAAAQTIGQNIRANEMLSVTLPFGWDLQYPKNSQKYAAQTMPSIQHHDVMIARAVLAQFINLGSTETGAYNLNASQMAAFLASLQAEAKYIEDVFNNDAIQRLVDYNFDGVEVYPTLKCSKISAMDFDILATALSSLVNMPTPLITPDPELEDYLREELGLPSAPKSTVNTTNPTAESTPERPETQPGDHSDAESKSTMGSASNPNSEIDTSIDDGDASGTLQAMSEVRLLREALGIVAKMDVVDHGLRHLELAERKIASTVEMCSCSPNTPAQQCICDEGCECRADGGSCPTEKDQLGEDAEYIANNSNQIISYNRITGEYTKRDMGSDMPDMPVTRDYIRGFANLLRQQGIGGAI